MLVIPVQNVWDTLTQSTKLGIGSALAPGALGGPEIARDPYDLQQTACQQLRCTGSQKWRRTVAMAMATAYHLRARTKTP